jgi:hypothetical protein
MRVASTRFGVDFRGETATTFALLPKLENALSRVAQTIIRRVFPCVIVGSSLRLFYSHKVAESVFSIAIKSHQDGKRSKAEEDFRRETKKQGREEAVNSRLRKSAEKGGRNNEMSLESDEKPTREPPERPPVFLNKVPSSIIQNSNKSFSLAISGTISC